MVSTKILAIQKPESGTKKWHSEGQIPILGKLTHMCMSTGFFFLVLKVSQIMLFSTQIWFLMCFPFLLPIWESLMLWSIISRYINFTNKPLKLDTINISQDPLGSLDFSFFRSLIAASRCFISQDSDFLFLQSCILKLKRSCFKLFKFFFDWLTYWLTYPSDF